MRSFFSLLMLLVFAKEAFTQLSRGTIITGQSIESKILGKSVRYSIYLPFDYNTSKRNYPVTYLLHGGGGNEESWVEMEAHLTVDEAIAERQIPPMILIMPDAGTSRYVNSFDSSVRYEDFFFKEFIPGMESKYRIQPGKRNRAIGGFSMGGYSSLVYVLKHPEIFTACAAFSAAIYTEEMVLAMTQEEWDVGRGAAFGLGSKGRDRFTAHFKSYDPIQLAQAADTTKLKTVRLYIDCGDDDFRNEGNASFHILLKRRRIQHEYRVRDGGHTRTYWRTGLLDGLKFIGSVFRGDRPV